MRIIDVKKFLITSLLLLLVSSFLFARALEDDGATKKFDEKKVHRVGNIWMRVSNYGFFGSGNTVPQWPSLEYPGGSSIDYLYQGALWFGAKKIRRNNLGDKLYWVPDPEDEFDTITEYDPDFDSLNAEYGLDVVLDTLVTVGFDGDLSLYEFLPAYNPLEAAAIADYSLKHNQDTIMSASIRQQRRGIDDDGDGLVDEDPVGYSFPFRPADELPEEFSHYGGMYPHDFENIAGGYAAIDEYIDIWYPRGFVDLSYDPIDTDYLFTAPKNDDGDGLVDEDGAPVSEQDFISFYYDYSPFPDGFAGTRHWGSSTAQNRHYPLDVRVRQSSYQWSFDYIKNLIYIEFNITNMSQWGDTLYDCAMGIYMDCDIGPQAWTPQQRAEDDVSGYVRGEGFEFAYSYDADGDGGLTTGMIGARVCTPDPEQLDFACWFWAVGQGPDDFKPLELDPSPLNTANEKYWLLTGRNPEYADGSSESGDKYRNLRMESQDPNNPMDTRFLFGFYGDQQGYDDPTEASWNLAPGRTMKIVVAVFPGEDLQELRNTSLFAKEIYGQAQTLTTVVEPDIFPHYQAFEPPPIPNMYAEAVNNGKAIDVYWENGSQMDNFDAQIVNDAVIGWQDENPSLDSHISNIPDGMEVDPAEYNSNAEINPLTAFRLRHDFQGYALYGRSGSGNPDHWEQIERWDKADTEQDYSDYDVNMGLLEFVNYGGDTGIDKGLPNVREFTEEDTNYFYLNEDYELVNYKSTHCEDHADLFAHLDGCIFGEPIYDHNVVWTDSLETYAANFSNADKILLFRNEKIPEHVYLSLHYDKVQNDYNSKLIPLPGLTGYNVFHDSRGNYSTYPDRDNLELQRRDRLSRRFYKATIHNPPRGTEYYVAVTAWDRGMPSQRLASQESGKDEDANMRIFFPGPKAQSNMDDIFVTPNPYKLRSKYDVKAKRENDDNRDKSRRLWFANLPEKCTIRIYTLAGDLVDTLQHDGNNNYEDIITISKDGTEGLASSGIKSWNMLSRYNQIIAPGVYLYSVEDEDGNIKVDKFVVIK